MYKMPKVNTVKILVFNFKTHILGTQVYIWMIFLGLEILWRSYQDPGTTTTDITLPSGPAVTPVIIIIIICINYYYSIPADR